MGYMDAKGCVYLSLVVRKKLVESGKLNSLRDLKGQRIATNPMSAKAYFLEKLLNTGALTSNDIEIVDMTDAVMFDALKNETLDAAVMSEPWLTRILQTGHAVSWIPAPKVIPNFQYMFVLYGPTLLKKNPEAGRRLMIAFLKAIRQYNQGKTERNLKILVKHTGLDQDILRQACWLPAHHEGRVHVQSVLDFQAWALKKGLLDKEVPQNQFWDPSFIEYATKVLRTSEK